jgi:hypothetical protein
MRGLPGVLIAGLVTCGAAQAQEWQTYTYPEPGFAIQFPGVPDVQTSKFKNAVGVTLPVTRYVVRQDGVVYTLSVANYSNTNADALGTIAETAKSFSAKGKVNADSAARVNRNHGRELTITESDGSRSDIAIFFVDNRLYTAVGQALPPNPADRSADTTHFQQSLRFLDGDSIFPSWFGGGSRSSPQAPASTASIGSTGTGTNNSTSVNTNSNISTSAKGVGAGIASGGAGSNGGEHLKTANQSADAACVGKSAGDVVQMDTPAGPVRAACILTARPIPP